MKGMFALAGAALLLAFAACDKAPADPDPWLPSPPLRGVVVASASCAPCHGAALRGDSLDPTPTPSLALARLYTWDQFDSLLSTGTTLNGHGVNAAMMASNVSSVSPADRRALHDYLLRYWMP